VQAQRFDSASPQVPSTTPGGFEERAAVRLPEDLVQACADDPGIENQGKSLAVQLWLELHLVSSLNFEKLTSRAGQG